MKNYIEDLEKRNELLSNRLEAAEEVLEYIDKNPGRMAFDLMVKEYIEGKRSYVERPFYNISEVRSFPLHWSDIWDSCTLFWFRNHAYNFNDTFEVAKKYFKRFVVVYDSTHSRDNYDEYYLKPFGNTIKSKYVYSITTTELLKDFDKHKDVLETYSCFIFSTKVTEATTKKYFKKFNRMFSQDRKNLLFIVLHMGEVCRNT